MNAAGDSNPRVSDAAFSSRIAFSENLTERCAIRDPLSTKGRSALLRDDRDGRKIPEKHPSPNRDSAGAKCNPREVLQKKERQPKSSHRRVPPPLCSTTSSAWPSGLWADQEPGLICRILPNIA